MSKQRTNRSSSRLAAVQALYEYGFGEKTIDQIAREFMNGDIGAEVIEETDDFGTEEFVPVMPAEPTLFSGILASYAENADHINEMIKASLAADWTEDRVEKTLKAILQAGVAELLAFPETPVAVVLKEYVDLTSCFYEGAEIRVVNGMLSNIAKALQSA